MSKIFSSHFGKLILVYIFWLASWILAGSLFEVYFYNLGLSLEEIFLAGFFWFAGGPLLIPLFRKFDTKPFMLLGIALAFAGVSVLYLLQEPWTAYVFRFIVGLPNLFFWVPFNIEFYKHREENAAFLGTVYFSTAPLLSLLLPALGGNIASVFGYSNLYIISMVGYVITFLLAWKLIDNEQHEYDTIKSLKSIDGLKSIAFLEGFSAAVITQITLETMLLIYVDKPAEYGSFVSLTTIFSIAAAVLIAKLSDKYKHRRWFLYITVFAFSLAAIFASQVQEVATFFLAFGLVYFFRSIFFPLHLAIVVDNAKSLTETMMGREFMLGVGRTFGVLFGYLILINSDIKTTLLIQGVIFLAYIPILETKKKKLARS